MPTESCKTFPNQLIIKVDHSYILSYLIQTCASTWNLKHPVKPPRCLMMFGGEPLQSRPPRRPAAPSPLSASLLSGAPRGGRGDGHAPPTAHRGGFARGRQAVPQLAIAKAPAAAGGLWDAASQEGMGWGISLDFSHDFSEDWDWDWECWRMYLNILERRWKGFTCWASCRMVYSHVHSEWWMHARFSSLFACCYLFVHFCFATSLQLEASWNGSVMAISLYFVELCIRNSNIRI